MIIATTLFTFLLHNSKNKSDSTPEEHQGV